MKNTHMAVKTPRAEMTQHSERAVPDEAEEILAAGSVAHAGFLMGAQPFVIPMSYLYSREDPGKLYMHGAVNSRAVLAMASGAPLCVTVTLLDGLVYSKTALYHSMNYRSVICFGAGSLVTSNDVKRALLDRMIGRYFEGRRAGHEYAHAPGAHLAATQVVEMRIEEMTAKARRGGPKGPGDDVESAPGTSGVVPMRA